MARRTPARSVGRSTCRSEARGPGSGSTSAARPAVLGGPPPGRPPEPSPRESMEDDPSGAHPGRGPRRRALGTAAARGRPSPGSSRIHERSRGSFLPPTPGAQSAPGGPPAVSWRPIRRGPAGGDAVPSGAGGSALGAQSSKCLIPIKSVTSGTSGRLHKSPCPNSGDARAPGTPPIPPATTDDLSPNLRVVPFVDRPGVGRGLGLWIRFPRWALPSLRSSPR